MNDSLMPQENPEQNEAANKVFLNLEVTDSATGIPSLNQGPASGLQGPSKSKLDTQMMIAGIVLLIGVGAVYGMRYLGMAAGLDESVVSIDYTSQAATPEVNKRYHQVMGALDDSTRVRQFSDEVTLPEHPFAREALSEDADIPIDPGMSEEERLALQRQRDFENAKAARENEIAAELYSFELQGVIGGKRPAARISGHAVRVGMELGSNFKVVEITGRTVIIEADGLRYELAMGQPAQLVD